MAQKRTTKEEKYNLLLSFFKETEDVYTLKDLEKTASKAKGLAQNVIKETLQRLVDDGQVDEGKIGSQNYYWRFESKALQEKKDQLDALVEKTAKRSEHLKTLEDKLNKIKPSDYENTEELVKEIDELKVKIKSIEEQIKIIEQSGDAEELIKECNEWTDNIFLIKSYVKKMGMDVKLLDKQYNIPNDLDYL